MGLFGKEFKKLKFKATSHTIYIRSVSGSGRDKNYNKGMFTRVSESFAKPKNYKKSIFDNVSTRKGRNLNKPQTFFDRY